MVICGMIPTGEMLLFFRECDIMKPVYFGDIPWCGGTPHD